MRKNRHTAEIPSSSWLRRIIGVIGYGDRFSFITTNFLTDSQIHLIVRESGFRIKFDRRFPPVTGQLQQTLQLFKAQAIDITVKTATVSIVDKPRKIAAIGFKHFHQRSVRQMPYRGSVRLHRIRGAVRRASLRVSRRFPRPMRSVRAFLPK